MGAFVACSLLRIDPDAAKLPCSAASLLYPSRVARISRLIGKSDTTVNRDGWQVHFSGTQGSLIPFFLGVLNLGFDSMQMASSPIPASKRRKRHSKRSGVFAVLRWSLASQILWWTAVFPPCLLQTIPAGHSLFEGRFVCGCSCRGVCFVWAGRTFSSSRYITGTLVVAIQLPFAIRFCFNNL
jgi:hypothetical protein